MSDIAFQMIFNPQNCTLDLLEATLTRKRKELAQHVIERTEEACRRGLACHHLVVGPRGSGKTHVFSTVRKRLELLCADQSSLKVIALSEEERSITRVLDFLLACIRALGLPLAETMAQLRSVPRPQATAEALSVFEQAVADKSTLILVENFDRLLAGMNADAIGELRAFFQGHNRVSLLASATSLFQDSNQPDHPFYGFFLIEPLLPLDAQGAREFLILLAESVGDTELAALLRRPRSQSRVNAVYDLTGGNHRLLAMLSSFLTVAGLSDLVGPFVQMVDRELTPYYQQRLDRLNGQQNQILRAIVDIPSLRGPQGRAVSLAEIVDYSFLTSQHCSRLLYDLRYTGLIRTQKKGRESLYELNEPLLRLIMDVKEGRNRPLPLVVNLLKLWYEASELQELANKTPEGIREYYLEAQRESESRSETATMKTVSSVAKSVGDIVEISRTDAMGTNTRSILGGQYSIKHEALEDLSTQAKEIQDLLDKGVRLGLSGELDKALVLLEEVVNLTTHNPEHTVVLARALFSKGATLGQLDRPEEAITVYDAVVERFGDSHELPLLEPVARALVNKGARLGQLDRSEEEITACDTVVDRFGENSDDQIRQQVLSALGFSADCLLAMSKETEALERSAKAIELAPESANAVGIHVKTLLHVHQHEEALHVLEAGLEQVSGNPSDLSFLVVLVLEGCIQDHNILVQVLEILKRHESILARGLVAWIKSLLPMSEDQAKNLDLCEAVFKETLTDVGTCQPMLEMFSAVRRDALGDKHALMDLPLELRRLIRPEEN